jgi:hypothetical protein
MAKPGTRWRHNLAVPGDQLEKGCVGIDCLKPVQHKDLSTRAASYGLELDAGNRELLTIFVPARHWTPFLGQAAVDV